MIYPKRLQTLRQNARCWLALCGLFLALGLQISDSQAQPQPFIRADRLGIAHISAASPETPDERYQQALLLGAGWNRWPLYWNWVEPEPGRWQWEDYDRQVRRDLEHGLSINAILLGRPEFYADGRRIQGLYEPIFADGSDRPGPDKALNPANPWAVFAFQAANRYRPGGVLARQAELPPGTGISVWEVWNEPDLSLFWSGSPRDYARLLKVAYIVIKSVDPGAQVMVGGLLYPDEDINWLAQVLNLYTGDAMAPQFNWYMDIVAIHSYANPQRSGWLTLVVRETLRTYGLSRPIWVTETGVPVWDDYPGPLWEPYHLHRATTQQQAWFLIQSAAHAWAEGAEKIFYHQLYDDCGDQPAGTNFPLHTGELCTGNLICHGDAHGIFRNQPDSVCFSQHPQPGTPRPVARAYRLLAEVFGSQPFDFGRRLNLDERAVTLAFERPHTGERITVMWNREATPAVLTLEARGENAQLLSLTDARLLIPDETGSYRVELPSARPDNHPSPLVADRSAIGGPPYILIERVGGVTELASIDLDALEIDTQPIQTTPVPTLPPPPPTVDPAFDTTPPVATVLELPETSRPTFTVNWRGHDDSGIERFIIWVRVDGGTWRPWLETARTSAEYTGTPGSVYEFAAWAVDLGGNWSENIDLQAQAVTRVE